MCSYYVDVFTFSLRPSPINTNHSWQPLLNRTVLVLNSDLVYDDGWKYKWREPLLVDAEGRRYPKIVMSFGNGTEVSYSCSVTFRNRFYVFGGENQSRQISKVTKCELKRIGSLDFDYAEGACSTVDDREIYLCFYHNGNKQCQSAVDPHGNFTKIAKSIFLHRFAKIAASPSKFQVNFIIFIITAVLLAVGSRSGPTVGGYRNVTLQFLYSCL